MGGGDWVIVFLLKLFGLMKSDFLMVWVGDLFCVILGLIGWDDSVLVIGCGGVLEVFLVILVVILVDCVISFLVCLLVFVLLKC